MQQPTITEAAGRVMHDDMIEITLSGGTCDAYLFHPEKSGNYPPVLFLPDAMGLRPAKRKMGRRLADAGYVVLLPNIFFRSAKPPVWDFIPRDMADPVTQKRFQELTGPITPAVMEQDASEYLDFLCAQDGVDPARAGVVGYCFSGAYAMRAAASRPDKIVAAASFHGGRLVTDAPDSPHLQLPRIHARLYFGHAVNDASMPADKIVELEAALAKWGGEYESETYADALHAWTVPGSPVYHHDQAERHFAKLTELFAATL